MINNRLLLAEKAAKGDMIAIKKLEKYFILEEEISRVRANEMISSIRSNNKMPEKLHKRFLTASKRCEQLGFKDIAELLRQLSSEKCGYHSKKKFTTIFIESERKRPYKLLRYNSLFKLPDLMVSFDNGYLPSKIKVERNVNYILSVVTNSYEPHVSIPIFISNESSELDLIKIDLSLWKGIGSKFSYIPKTKCTIGDDTGARDPLPELTFEVGPFAVSRFHVTMIDYLENLKNNNTNIIGSKYFPTYMGDPLFKFNNAAWVPYLLVVKKGFKWHKVPAVGVDFNCAHWYCSTLNLPDHLFGDLLNECEWEAVARGVDLRLFPWGNLSVPGFANIRIPGFPGTGLENVGNRKTDISPFGLYDCCGNAEEWCKFVKKISMDAGDKLAIARGGSWYNPEQTSRLASRVVRHKDYRHRKLSFRIAVRLRES